MIAEKDPYIKSSYDQLQLINQDKQKRKEYEAREKAIREHNQLIYEAEQRGEKYKAISITPLNYLTVLKHVTVRTYETYSNRIRHMESLPASDCRIPGNDYVLVPAKQ